MVPLRRVRSGVCDDSFGSRVAAKSRTAIGAEFLVRPDGEQLPTTSANYVSEPMNGLKPGFTYYYCVAASNLGGAKFGQVLLLHHRCRPARAGHCHHHWHFRRARDSDRLLLHPSCCQ